MATTPQYNFTVTQLDLDFILKQIKFAEQSTVINPLTGQADVANLANIISNGGSVTSAAVLPFGLRTVDGTWNNLLPGQERLGAADNIMPRLVPINLQLAEARPAGLFAPTAGTVVTSYAQTTGNVYDTQPRVASNLISDQTANNPAAVATALQLAGYTSAQITAEALIIAGLNSALQAQHVLVKAAQAAILAATPLTLAAAQQAYIDLTAPSTTIPPFAGGTYTQAADTLAARLVLDGLTISDNGTIGILNLSPDIGLSPSFNSWMTIFGQFFDHGLDLVTKGGNGTVFVPLLPDDPLYVAGSQTNFMVLTRATQVNGPGADGILLDNPLTVVNEAADNTSHETINTTTPFVDQNQTYTSHPSHQVFLREYARVADGPDLGVALDIVATGRLLNNITHAAGTWADVKAQARDMLGIQLVDMDVHNVPLLATDRYGEFIRGPNGFAQMVTATGLVEGDPAANGGLGVLVPANAVRTEHAFLNDIAHGAAPGFFDAQPGPGVNMQPLVADSDSLVGSLPNPNFNPALPVGPNNSPVMPQAFGTYDNELLDRHFITGDGRGNENIGLTAVHTIFHSEHNRLVEDYKHTILASGNAAFVTEWLRSPALLPAGPLPTSAAGIDALVLVLNASNAWDGERLFQAGRFVTEMQYQHMVFEEFARAVQPSIDPFVFSNSPTIDPAIMAEFAHVVYRFGHSMLTENVNRIGADMQSHDIGLIAAFLNPVEFDKLGGVQVSVEVAMGAIVRGMSRDTGNEIDEFVTEALRNNLVGLPLDLAVLNMARARETGMPSFNEARAAFFAATGDSQLKPLESWASMAPELKNPTSIINFIAAYGTHSTILNATTLADKRAAATSLVFGTRDLNADGDVTDPFETAPADRLAFLTSTGGWTAANSGLNDVDFWIGGLAERKNEFGGMLGATFNYVFETQLEKLQNGDRFYYLSRTQGTNMLNELEGNTFSKIIMRNTDLGAADSSHLSSLVFQTPNYTLELNQAKQIGLDPQTDNPILQILHPMVIRVAPGVDGNGGFLQFTGGEHVVLGGTAGNDTLRGGNGIDTLWGDAGNDRLDGGNEADQVHGGDGDDIITDAGTPAGGADFLRGDEGNDVISSGMGNDIVFGGGGNDFIITGNDFTEVFAGRGDDFVLGGTGPDVLMGNEGSDWLEGGEGLDNMSGENSELFFNSPIIGHDVLNGQGNDTDYDGESGDDIMIQTAGITRSNGMFGFDWGSHKGDTVAANSDLGIAFFPAQAVFTLRDRFDSVEGLSGWKLNDTLTGAARLIGFAGPGSPVDESTLKSQNVSLINGLAELLGLDPVATAALAVNTTVIDTTTGAEVIIGGGGSDMIRGNLGNDYLDGDAWLNTRIRVTHKDNPSTPADENANTAANEWFTVDSMNEIKSRMLTGEINPGQLHIVREILQAATAATDIDTAIYNGLFADYTVTANTNGSITVTHNTAGPASDGTDTIRNFEKLQFSDRVVTLSAVTITGSATEDQSLTAETAGILGTVLSFQWFRNGVAIAGATNNTLVLGDADVGMRITVLANFTDLAGNVTLVVSRPSAPVININDVPVGVPSISGIVTEDQVLTVSTASITDADGLGAFSYQWTRNGAAIVGATGTTLTLGDADVGAVIAVVVRYTDLNGTLEVLTSAATLPVVNVNDAPTIAATAAVTMVEDGGAATGIALGSDVDIGTVLSYSAGAATSGIATIDPLSGAWSYAPALNFNGTASFVVTVSDGLLSATQTVTVTVTPVNDLPALTGVQATLTAGIEDTAYFVSLADLLAGFTDVDSVTNGQVLSVANLLASNGTVALSLGGYTITPTLDFNGAVSLTYNVIDGAGGVLGATLSYTLTAANDPVTGAATAVLAAGSEGAAYTVTLASLLAGFSDVDIATNGQVLSVVGLLASSGSIAANPDGSYTITQAANFNGPVTLRYSVTDGNGSTVGASLGYGVTAANDPPILTGTQALLAAGTEDTAYFVSLADLLAGFTDVNVATNGQVLSIANLLPSNGLAVLGVNALGNAGYTITPTLDFNGAVSLTYNVIDGAGGVLGATLSYTLTAANDPVTGAATAVLAAGTEGSAYTVTLASLLTGFSDVDIATNGQALSVVGLLASSGTVVANLDGSYTITQATDFNGPVSLSYSVTDGNGSTVPAGQSYAVTAVNDLPALTGLQAALAAGTEDTAYFVSFASLLAGFSDVDVATNGQVLSIANLVAANGTVAPSLDGLGYTITPALNFNGTMALTYNVIDGNLGSIAASQSYAVAAVNDAPVGTASAVLIAGTEDTAYVVSAASLLAGFSDVDTGDILSVSGLTASDGSVVDNLDGTYTITPTLNFNGPVSLAYNVIDGNGGSVAASQSYSLVPVSDPTLGAVSISNLTPDLLRTLTVSNNLTDVDGVLSLLGYQWQSSPGGTVIWSNIAGATGASYTTDTAGVQLRVVASYTVSGGPVETMISIPVTAAVGALHIILGTNAAGETLIGTAVADQITGLGGNDVLIGGGGDDSMAGGLGHDTYEVTEAGDVVTEDAGAGADTVWAYVNHSLAANVENLILSSAIGNFTGIGNALNNLMIGSNGNDVLIGGGGDDSMAGGLGHDTYEVTEAGDVVTEDADAGADTVWAYVNYALTANVENLVFSGSAGNFNGTGNALNNLMVGGSGANTLDGGAGQDTLTGGAGADTFVVAALGDSEVGAGRDIITDFLSGTDRIQFTGIDANTGAAGHQAFTMINTAAFSIGVAGQLRYSFAGTDTLIEGDVNGDGLADFQIQLTGNHFMTAADLVV